MFEGLDINVKKMIDKKCKNDIGFCMHETDGHAMIRKEVDINANSRVIFDSPKFNCNRD